MHYNYEYNPGHATLVDLLIICSKVAIIEVLHAILFSESKFYTTQVVHLSQYTYSTKNIKT